MLERPNFLPQHQPVDYATPVAHPDSMRLRSVGVFSVITSLLTLPLSGYFFLASFPEMSDAARAIVSKRPEAFQAEFENQYSFAAYGSVIFGSISLLAVLLFAAAVMLLRCNRRGLRLHWIYIPLQIVASVALAIDWMWMLHNSPASMLFYLGPIPGAIGCIYPAVLLALLWKA